MKEPYVMFGEKDNYDLRQLLYGLINMRLGDSSNDKDLSNEVYDHEKRMSDSSQFKRLNRGDLVSLIYSIIYPEIMLIDTCSKDDLPMLMNKKWSCPELEERLKRRMRGDAP